VEYLRDVPQPRQAVLNVDRNWVFDLLPLLKGELRELLGLVWQKTVAENTFLGWTSTGGFSLYSGVSMSDSQRRRFRWIGGSICGRTLKWRRTTGGFRDTAWEASTHEGENFQWVECGTHLEEILAHFAEHEIKVDLGVEHNGNPYRFMEELWWNFRHGCIYERPLGMYA